MSESIHRYMIWLIQTLKSVTVTCRLVLLNNYSPWCQTTMGDGEVVKRTLTKSILVIFKRSIVKCWPLSILCRPKGWLGFCFSCYARGLCWKGCRGATPCRHKTVTMSLFHELFRTVTRSLFQKL